MTAPDGSPVALYLRLPPRLAEAEFVNSLLPPACALRSSAYGARRNKPSSILDLGCGTGRLAEPIAAKGHTIVAVDNEPEMLSHLRLSRPVLADIATLRLDEDFDAVLLMSHLVNHPDPAIVKRLLTTARNHLRPNGFAVIERYPPGWVATCAEKTTEQDGVRFILRDTARDAEGVLSATMMYEFDGKRFEQSFQAREFDEALLADFGHAYHLIP